MKRLINTLFLSICQTFVFAQRGKVRPEWDINGVGSHHSIDDDLYSFLFIVGLVVLYFVFLAIRGTSRGSRKSKEKIDHSSFGKTYDKLEEGCGIVFGGGCLILMVLAAIVFIIGLVKDCSTDSSKNTKVQTENGKEKRKEKTFVRVLYSDTDYKQIYEVSAEEFKGKDTVFYYEYWVFKNETGKSLTEYLVKYDSDGMSSIEILKTITPNQFFKSNVSIPFQKPPKHVDFSTTKVHFNNWKSRSRWGNKKETTKSLLFLDYTDYVYNIPVNRK